eukprot:CAMPEP_0202441780 /NCGR_PEP_ID=MMETSP1360-20130828/1284_1 /ASSEMBLY_ACC=CAM_ASM_000848 /TAXON_ID=515479 /ORGANISM="Licmophora paradoxa, Strain CCMP2313" /LENGTH=251 /DNA_ID=CAMNT_0049056913 /DNA_START=48 /DNA_END=803 /DNA_ORIENTATION=+
MMNFLRSILLLAFAFTALAANTESKTEQIKEGNVRRRTGAVPGPHIGTYRSSTAPPPTPSPVVPVPAPAPGGYNVRNGAIPFSGSYTGHGPLISENTQHQAPPGAQNFQAVSAGSSGTGSTGAALPAMDFVVTPIAGSQGTGTGTGNSGIPLRPVNTGSGYVFGAGGTQPLTPRPPQPFTTTMAGDNTVIVFSFRTGHRRSGKRDDCPDEDDPEIWYANTDPSKCPFELYACIAEHRFNDPDCGCGCDLGS